MARRETILLHSQHLKNLDKLSDDQAGKLLKSLYALMIEKEPEPMDAVTDMLFGIMRDWTLTNWEQYDKAIEAKREAGRKGGLAKSYNTKQNVAEPSTATSATTKDSTDKQTEAKPSKAKHNVNVNENANVNDNGSDKRDEWTLPYGTYLNVMVTAEEYEKLCESWKKEQVDEKIEHLSSYLKQGHEYKNHYVTLRDWLKKDYPEMKKTVGNDHIRRALKMQSGANIKIASNE